MAASHKKKCLTSVMGRKSRGCLITYPIQLRKQIKALRLQHPGWGATTIFMELHLSHNYPKSALPKVRSIHRFLKQEGLIAKREPKVALPNCPADIPQVAHELWEMDAKGADLVEGVGYQSLINIKDVLSKKYCMTFPVSVKNKYTQPSLRHYKWALRLAFIESGLPKIIQVDKDSVFIDNKSKSPFPSRLQLWLVALGIEVSFISKPPPQKNSIVERSHQTLAGQVFKASSYKNWKALFTACQLRRKRLNESYPSRALKHKSPLEAYPEAKHSGRKYSLQKESDLLDLRSVYTFLQSGKWYRKVSTSKIIHLGGQTYYLKNASPNTTACITFNQATKELIFHDESEKLISHKPIKAISKEALMEYTIKDLKKVYHLIIKSKNFSL